VSFDRRILDESAARRIAAIASLIQSPVDGEALAAARKLVKALDRHGLRIGDLLISALAPQPAPSVPGPPWWQAAALECVDNEPWAGCWPQRTIDFLDAMSGWPRPPSAAQRQWLENCLDLARSARAADGR
jgi:hypothetical protein